MAQFISQPNDFNDQDGEIRYEVIMVATGKDGAVVESTNPLPVTGGSGPNNALLVSLGGTNLDAFGRMRVSEPFTLADYSHLYGEDAELLTKKSGSGDLQLISNESSARLVVGTGNGDYVVHQSRMHHHYMPGKSQLALISFVLGNSRANTVKRIGLFGEEDGVYLQQNGSGALSFVKRTSISGSVVDETPILQSAWNVDTCDGMGPSGFDLQVENTQLFFCDYQWLGVGRLRVGFVHEGQFVVAHEFHHSNELPTVYWRNPSLPIRSEIRNIGIAVGTASLDHICSTVMSEGGYVEAGVNFSQYAENIPLLKGAPATAKCLLAVKLKNTYKGLPNRSIIRLTDLNILSDGAPIVYEVWRVPSASANITGGSWVDANSESVAQYNISVGTAFNTTNGELFASGFIAANNPSGKQASGGANIADPAQAKRAYLSQDIESDNSNVFLIVARNLSSTADTNVYASLQWRETR